MQAGTQRFREKGFMCPTCKCDSRIAQKNRQRVGMVVGNVTTGSNKRGCDSRQGGGAREYQKSIFQAEPELRCLCSASIYGRMSFSFQSAAREKTPAPPLLHRPSIRSHNGFSCARSSDGQTDVRAHRRQLSLSNCLFFFHLEDVNLLRCDR